MANWVEKIYYLRGIIIVDCGTTGEEGMIKNSNGLTVPELINFLQSLPEPEHKDDVGEVWVTASESQGRSNIAHQARKLNKNDVLLILESEE